MHHSQVEFILGMPNWFNIQNQLVLLTISTYIKNHMSISPDTRKVFNKIQRQLVIKHSENQE